MTDQTETALTLLVGAALEKHGSWPEGAHRAIAKTILEAGWRAPSTQDETEWGYQFEGGDVVDRWGSERQARAETLRAIEMTGKRVNLVRRQIGPWVSVSSVEGDKP